MDTLQLRQEHDTLEHGPAYGKLAPRGVPIVILFSIFLVLATGAVILRFYSNHICRRGHRLYDWLVLGALVFYWAAALVSFLMLFIGGVGWHVQELGTKDVQTGLKLTMAVQVFYALCMGLLKSSICLMLIRIFVSNPYIYASWALLILNTAWIVMAILIGLLICHPIGFNWDTSLPNGHCGNQNASLAAISGIEVVIDAAIMVLPLPMVWSLQTQRATKIALTFVFGLGIVTIITTSFRLSAILHIDFSDYSYSTTPIIVWSIIELGTAVTVTCSLTLRPLLEKIFNERIRTIGTLNGSSVHGRKASKKDQSTTNFDRIRDNEEIALGPQEGRYTTKVGRSESNGSERSLFATDKQVQQIDLGPHISVKTQWTIISS